MKILVNNVWSYHTVRDITLDIGKGRKLNIEVIDDYENGREWNCSDIPSHNLFDALSEDEQEEVKDFVLTVNLK